MTDVTNPALVDPEGTIARAIDTAVREAALIELGFRYEYTASGSDTFSVDTNIGSLIIAALKKTAEEYAKKAADELERAVRSYIASYIGEEYLSNEDLDALFTAARGDRDAVNGLQTRLQDKLSEMERSVRNAAEEAKEQSRRAAEEAAASAAKKAEETAKSALQGLFGR
jgi:hypothetical protein